MLPFPRGEFVDSLPEGILGKVYAVADNEVKGLTGRNSNEYVYLKVVKNSSGIALLPKRLAKPKISSTIGFETEIAGYTTVDAEDCYPIDEYLPASGVPDANYFYVVVGGPATVLTSLAGDARNVISEMNYADQHGGRHDRRDEWRAGPTAKHPGIHRECHRRRRERGADPAVFGPGGLQQNHQQHGRRSHDARPDVGGNQLAQCQGGCLVARPTPTSPARFFLL
jgi:hypothetical protein